MLGRFLSNSTWVSASVAVEIGVGMAISWLLARQLGPEGFGNYSYWFSLTALFSTVYDFGLTALALREVAQYPRSVASFIRRVWAIKSALGLVAITLMGGIAGALELYSSSQMRNAFLLLSLSQIARSASLTNRFVARGAEWMRIQALVDSAGNLARLLVLGFILAQHGGLFDICLGLAITNTLELGLTSYFVWVRVSSNWDTSSLPIYTPRSLLKKSMPFAAYDFLNGLYMRADSVFVGSLAGAEAVAWYSSAYKLVNLIAYVPRTLSDGAYPILCKESREGILQIVRRLLVSMIVIGFPISLVVTVFSQDIIQFIYGSEYGQAASALAILVWASFAVSGGSILLAALNALGQEKSVARITAAVALAGVCGYLLAIPRLGYLGACAISVTIEFMATILMYVVAQRKFANGLIGKRTGLRLALAMLMALSMGVFVTYKHNAPITGLGLAMAIYLPIAGFEWCRVVEGL